MENSPHLKNVLQELRYQMRNGLPQKKAAEKLQHDFDKQGYCLECGWHETSPAAKAGCGDTPAPKRFRKRAKPHTRPDKCFTVYSTVDNSREAILQRLIAKKEQSCP